MTSPGEERELATIMAAAEARGATAVHFTPSAPDEVEVRVKVADELLGPGQTVGAGMLAYLLRTARLDVGPSLRWAMVRFGASAWRVMATPLALGPHVSLHRVADRLALDELGLTPGQLDEVSHELDRTRGLTVLCGPPGSGVTTTFYAVLEALDPAQRLVATVEDPVERHVAGMLQQSRPTAPVEPLELARAVLRHGPHVVGIGAIHDRPTAALAYECAASGVKVVATAMAGAACGAMTRLYAYAVEPFQIIQTTRQVVCQRLVRLTCPHCAAPDPAGRVRLFELGVTTDHGLDPQRGVGCGRCAGTGRFGATAIFEVLDFSPEIVELVLQGASAAELEATAEKAGMVTLRRAAVGLVADGRLSVREALRALG